jgi:hypothetical protein
MCGSDSSTPVRAPVVDKFVTHTTTASLLFCLNKKVKSLNNINNTNYTRQFKFRLHTSPVNVTGSPSHNGLHF